MRACKGTKSKIIYISTDYIFDGKKGMYKETDKAIPINYYGKTKLETENNLSNLRKEYPEVRGSTNYGYTISGSAVIV